MDVRMARLNTADDEVRAADVAGRIGAWGFLAHPDLPDGPGPASLVVALRASPTMQHYDPEAIDYWVSDGGRGWTTDDHARDPRCRAPRTYSWGLIRLVDRLGISNEYLTFGGHLDAAMVDGVVVAAFASPAPLLRRGGHSQAWDAGADALGGFFARMMVAVDYKPGFEALFAAADPLARYAAFIRDTDLRRRGTAIPLSPTTTSPGSPAVKRPGCGCRHRRRGRRLTRSSRPRPGG